MAGMFERAFFSCFIMGPTGQLNLRDISMLLSYADRNRLRSIGTPFQVSTPITLYRGTSKISNRMALRPSWTESIEIAKFFAQSEAERYGSDCPTVYEMTVPPEYLVFYTDDRREKEFFVEIWPQAKPRRMPVQFDDELVHPDPMSPETRQMLEDILRKGKQQENGS